MNLYIDDSGTRHPDHRPGRTAAHGYDWFAFGGVLIKQEDEKAARIKHAEFSKNWNIAVPLHSSEIRSKSKGFSWLGKLETEELERFLEELYLLMSAMPVTGIGCVIDRPGYNARYREKYGRQRWSLCKTAFGVVVERAAKYAHSQGYKLRVFVERSDKKTDRQIKQYYDDLRSNGMPFDSKTSEKYAPLKASEFADTLYDFKTKNKSSPIMQIADLYLWPICMGGYDPNNRPYARLKRDGKLIDCLLKPEEISALGIKYSCWELANKVMAKNH